MSGSVGSYFYRLVIREGNTELASQQNSPSLTPNVVAIVEPTAGTHTYAASVNVGASANVTLEATSSSKAFILVERIG